MAKRYFLDKNGNILGAEDIDKEFPASVILDDPPDDGKVYKRNGVPGDKWIVDEEATNRINQAKTKQILREQARSGLAALRAEQAGQEDRLDLKDVLARVKKIEEILGLDNQ